MKSSDERGPWYLVTGLVIGILLGLAYAWSVQPVQYTNTSPSTLRQDFKDQYRALIAAAFLGNGDVVRAEARLKLLMDDDMFRALTEQAQRTLAENGSDNQARALGLLAIALGKEPPGPSGAVTQAERGPTAGPTEPFPTPPVFDTATPEEPAVQPSPTETTVPPTVAPPIPTETAPLLPAALSSSPEPTANLAASFPKATAEASPAALNTPPSTSPFVLLSKDKICDQKFEAPVFQLQALDRFNQPLTGVPVIVTWPGGNERFLTGLKPEIGPGFADFTPTPGVLYTVQLGDSGTPVSGLAAVMCSQGGNTPVWGAWLLKFVQP